MTRQKGTPTSVVHRLTRYLACVQEHSAQGGEWISSQELADRLGLTSSTVRQDLSHLDFSGISKRGYETAGLERALRNMLGADKSWRMVVVGAGNLGRALALHEEFSRRGFQIRGIFDADDAKVGQRVGDLVIRDMCKLPRFVRDDAIEIGVIAVPSGAAQSVADLLIASGVKGLLNMTLTHVVSPRRVAVVDSRIVSSLLELAHALRAL
jgi:redox-sensing transcriptional repressor